MAGESDQPKSDGTWHWAYLIPITALMIPLAAILAGSDVLTPLLVTIVAIVGVTIGVGSLLRYQHTLRMKELNAQREIAALEAQQLTQAQRVLDLDDRTEQLRQQVRKEETN